MAVNPGQAFIWGSGGAQMTPEEITAQRKVAQAMLAQGGDYTPVQSWTQGAARVAQAMFGGMQAHDANEAAKTNAANDAAMLASLFGGGATPTATPVTPATSIPPMGGAGPSTTTGKIYSNDEPSPLDPPSGADRQAMIQTILGEAGNQAPIGQQAVASVIRNRAVNGGYGGDTPQGVVQAPNQFEPWNTAAGRSRMAAAASDPAQAAQADAAISAAYGEGGGAPSDPTNGAVNFIAPKAQVALGRTMPAWAQGQGQDIGDHRFFGGAQAPTQVASNDPAALPANSQPTQGFAVPGQPTAPTVNPRLLSAMSSPYVSDGTKKILGLVLAQQMEAAKQAADPLRKLQIQEAQTKLTPFGAPETDAQGNLVQRDALGKVTVLNPAEKRPTSVSEYEYGLTHPDFPKEQIARAKAGATNVNVGGGSDKQIFDTFAENTKEARSAATGLVALRNARLALQGPGGVITGSGADERLAFQKLGAALGVTDPGAIQNTETFRAAIAPQVASTLKATVGTNQISNSDREFAEKAAGGSIKLDSGSINRLLDIMEKAGTARLQLHQQQLDAVYPDPEKNRRERALFGVKMPDAPQAPVAPPDRSAIEAEMKRRGLL